MNLEFLIDREYISLYINGIWPNGIGVDVPTWFAFGTIAFIYSIISQFLPDITPIFWITLIKSPFF